MLPARRQQSTSVIDQLLADPESFSFSQLVRLVERSLIYTRSPRSATSSPDYGLVGDFTPPTQETLRFYTRANLGFPEAEVARLDLSRGQEAGALKAQINVLNLLGAMGVLPFHYTELALQRLKQKDESFTRFLDLFNHRLASLLYRAQTKYSLAQALERDQLAGFCGTRGFTPSDALASLVGMGTAHLREQSGLSEQSLIYYAGLFSTQVRTSVGLSRVLADYFGISVRIEQFVGHWQELIGDIRTRLGWQDNRAGQNAALGRSMMLGSRAWIAQGKVRIVVGPLGKNQLDAFAPGTATFNQLNKMVQLYLGPEQDYEFEMAVKPQDLPARLQLNRQAPPVLGWSSWLKDSQGAAADTTVAIKVSARAN